MKKVKQIQLIIATMIVPYKLNFFSICLFVSLLFSNTGKANQSPMLLRLFADGSGMQNQTVLYFDSAATYNYNPLFDAPSLGVNPGYLNVISSIGGIDYQIKGLPSLNMNMSIPIKIVTGTSGVYQIYGGEIQNLPSGTGLILHDNLNNTNQDLRLGAYACFISDTETVARFVLNMNASSFSAIASNQQNPVCVKSANGFIIATAVGVGLCNYYWKDSANNIVKVSFNKFSSDTLTGLNAGAYRVDVNPAGTTQTGIRYFSLKGDLSAQALFTPDVFNATMVGGTAGVNFLNQSTNSTSFWWDFGDGMGCVGLNTSHYYYSPGTFTVTLTSQNTLCPETGVYSQLITINPEQSTWVVSQPNVNAIQIEKDLTGYYVKFNFKRPENAVISVINEMGQKIIEDIVSINVLDNKIYVKTENFENQILIIIVTTNSGEKFFRKILK